jgi:hypothetical protein
MSVSCPKWAIHETERTRRTVVPSRSNCPFTVPGSVNKFAGNLSVTDNYLLKTHLDMNYRLKMTFKKDNPALID